MPRRARKSCSSAARGVRSQWNSAVPPSGTRPYAPSKAASRCPAACRRRARSRRAAALDSASAWMPSARAGPLTVHGPRRSASSSSNAASASTKPRRTPARPKNLPNERSTISPGLSAWAATLNSGVQSMNASSTSRQPPRAYSRACQSSSCSAANSSPLGLLGLASTSTSRLSSRWSMSTASRRTSRCPARCQAWACSA
ncbi:hypothetical protein D3C86_1540970 [compost metagenome]